MKDCCFSHLNHHLEVKNFDLVSNQRSSFNVSGFLRRVQVTLYLRLQKLSLALGTATSSLAGKLHEYICIYCVTLATVQFPLHMVAGLTAQAMNYYCSGA